MSTAYSRRQLLRLSASVAASIGLGRQWLAQAATSESLRASAARRGITVCSDYVEPWRRASAQVDSLLGREFNRLKISGMLWARPPEQVQKWGFVVLRPGPDEYDFSDFDAAVAYAKSHDMRVRSGLIWDLFLPAWLTEGTWSPADAEAFLREHIKTMMQRYKGIVDEWIVVNEPPGSWFKKGDLPGQFWHRTLGPGYVAMAFQIARETDPSATLILNNFEREIPYPVYGHLDTEWVRKLSGDGLLDVYGSQMHVPGERPFPPSELRATFEHYLGLDVGIAITEFDVSVKNMTGTEEERFAKQAEIYGGILDEYFAVGGRSVTFFGINDMFSWLGAGANPTLFDRQSAPKPAYARVLQSIGNVPLLGLPYRSYAPGIGRD